MIGRKQAMGSLLAVVLAVSPNLAAADELDAIPDSAAVVVKLKRPQDAVKKFANFVKAVEPRYAQMAQQWNNMIGIPISNPTLAGVDGRRDWWIAVFPKPEGEPSIVFCIPATNADAMRQGLGGAFETVEHERYLLYTKDAEAAQEIKARIGGDGQSIKTAIDEKSQAVIGAGDLSVFVNVPRLREVYAAQLDAAQTEIEGVFDQLSELTPQVPGVDMKPVFEMYGQLLKGLLQAVDDIQGVTGSVSIKTRSIDLEEYYHVTADSPTDKFLQNHPPAQMQAFAKLPADKMMYFGFHGNMQALMDWSLKLTAAMMPQEGEDAVNLEEALAPLKEIEYGSYLAAVGLGDLKEGALRIIQVTEAKPTDKMREFMRNSVELMAKMNFGGVKQEIDLQTEAEEFGAHKADVMKLKQEVPEELDPLGMQKKIFEAMYGPEGATTRIIYLPDMVLQTVGGGRETMEEALAAVTASDRTGSPRSAHQALQAQLLEKANLLVMFDLPGLVSEAVTMVVESGQLPVPIDAAAIKNLKLERSYVGFAVATEPSGLRSKCRIPTGQVQGILKLVQVFQEMQQSPQL